MRKMTGILAVMAIAVNGLLLTGCGQSASSTTETQATEQETEETAATETIETGTEEAAAEESEEPETEEAAAEESEEPETEEAAAEEEETEEAAAEETASLADETVGGWHFVVEDMRLDASLENVSVELGYTGVETSSYEKEASEGNQFCLIKLLIEKDGSKEEIDWENLVLTDQDGTEYARLDDEFIVDLGMMRMPGTNLNFGSNEGWIAFEVAETAETFTLSYAFEEESFSCELKDE